MDTATKIRFRLGRAFSTWGLAAGFTYYFMYLPDKRKRDAARVVKPELVVSDKQGKRKYKKDELGVVVEEPQNPSATKD
ncbi:hypothetical protein NDN08_000838 [Rhodosorus marinus]|uniref:Uncharacterized protein n=1 Tax=Rhodosorus marinus TaxID=101924 RepID=A0AAV8UT60_9RHOD|nr:hypothetical protein NDN08_000838 [Rhodosorus marinus]